MPIAQIQSDPNVGAVGSLCILTSKNGISTSGEDVPVVPYLSTPPPTVVQAQVILDASLVASLFLRLPGNVRTTLG